MIKPQDFTQSKVYNATVKISESTKFPDEQLVIPLRLFVTVPATIQLPDGDNSIAIAVAVSLLVVIAVVVLVWKLKTRKKKDSGIYVVYNPL